MGTFPGAPRGPSVPARAASRLTHPRWSSHPKPEQARRSRLGRGCRKNGVHSQRISQEEAQRADGESQIDKKIPGHAHSFWPGMRKHTDRVFHRSCWGRVYAGRIFKHLLHMPGACSAFDTLISPTPTLPGVCYCPHLADEEILSGRLGKFLQSKSWQREEEAAGLSSVVRGPGRCQNECVRPKRAPGRTRRYRNEKGKCRNRPHRLLRMLPWEPGGEADGRKAMSLPPLHAPQPRRSEAASGQVGSVRDLLGPACPETLRLWSIFIGPRLTEESRGSSGSTPCQARDSMHECFL